MERDSLMTPTYLWLLLVLLTLVQRYLLRQDEACKLIGRALASPEFLKINKDGLQTAVMIPEQNKWFFLVTALIIGDGGWLLLGFGWVAALVGVVIWLLVGSVSGIFLFPRADSRYFLRQTFASMSRRLADYQRDGDVQRAYAMGSLLKEFLKHYETEITKP